MNYYVNPWAHQLDAIEFSRQNKNVALFWEMGTGKTATTINILRHQYALNGGVVSTLILAPIVVLENWRREFMTHARMPENNVLVLKGTGKKKCEQLNRLLKSGGSKIIIGNYEIMQNKEIVKLLEHWGPSILVCDESQRCKSHTSKRAKAIAKLADGCKHKYLLSGTPVLNSPMDIYMQFRILDGGELFGKNFYGFRNKFFHDKNAGMPKHVHFPKWEPKPGVHVLFNKMIAKKALRATKEDCLDLPPLIRETLNVDLSPEQRRAYKEMHQDFVTYINDEACVASLAITKGLRLQQIVSGFLKTDDGNIIRFKKTPREKELELLLADLTPSSKVIVWANFKENYKQIAEICKNLQIDYAELHGGVKDKDEQIESFRKNDKIKVMIANPQSAGLGVNLIEAKYSVYYSKGFSLEHDLQSEARNHRGGSDKLHDKITRIDLVAPGTLDEQVTEALANKQDVAALLLNINNQTTKQRSIE